MIVIVAFDWNARRKRNQTRPALLAYLLCKRRERLRSCG
ncbi:hypothetical protein BRPE64_CCDS01870 [Caballeronia insecticola]|uniref:Uncharacterized protein n=1 Tax=Caballeronia insecticola TaxID=758793 RepID=R4WY50_9BURK|nr:hypothetical protein BRPE64_CCDS01870 [Caballeronia insecticola]